MSRASRLSEIAKSNEPAFNGTYWWLADPASNTQPAKVADPESHAEELVPVAATHASAQTNGQFAEPRLVNRPQAAQLPVSMATAQLPAPVAESAQTSNGLGSRLGGLREKFLWLGRRSRSVPQE
jgi:hypothetical protein